MVLLGARISDDGRIHLRRLLATHPQLLLPSCGGPYIIEPLFGCFEGLSGTFAGRIQKAWAFGI